MRNKVSSSLGRYYLGELFKKWSFITIADLGNPHNLKNGGPQGSAVYTNYCHLHYIFKNKSKY